MTAVSLFSPTVALALTPTQWFNQLARTSSAQSTVAADATIDIGVIERFLDKKRKGSSGNVNLSMSLRTPQAVGNIQTSEGMLSLNKLKVTGMDLGLPFEVNEPIAFEWKQTSDSVFIRVTKVPASLLEYAKELSQVDYSGLIGKWIAVPFDQQSLLEEVGIKNSDNANDAINKGPLAKTQLITSVRQEKKWKNAAGQDMIRLTGRLNPAIATILYQEQVKQAKKDYPVGAMRTTRLNELYKDYVKSLAAVKSVYLAANINTTTKQFERIEFSAKITEPKEECTWNSSYTKENCKKVGTTETTVKGGINLKKDSGAPVMAPAEFMTMQDVMAYLESQLPTPEPFELFGETLETEMAP